jgi:hypothetical protein
VFVGLRGSTTFTGDGLMALFGLNAKDPAIGVAGALCGAVGARCPAQQPAEGATCRSCYESESAFISARPLSAKIVEFCTLNTLADLHVIRHSADAHPGRQSVGEYLLVPIRC